MMEMIFIYHLLLLGGKFISIPWLKLKYYKNHISFTERDYLYIVLNNEIIRQIISAIYFLISHNKIEIFS